MKRVTRTPNEKPAILIVDHGTRNADARQTLVRLAAEVARERPGWIVEHAHMELADPDFDAGIDRLVARGATRILVHLHFLGAGYHVRESIPQLVDKARQRHRSIEIHTSEPLGHDPRIVELVVGRMDRHDGDEEPTD